MRKKIRIQKETRTLDATNDATDRESVLALLPWLFMVHAKLAVISIQIADMVEKVAKLQQAEDARIPKCIQHGGRLGDLERRVEILEK